MSPVNSKSRPLRVVFAVPAVLGAATAVGLLTALIGDGIWDVASWLLLAIPVVLALWCMWGRRTRR